MESRQTISPALANELAQLFGENHPPVGRWKKHLWQVVGRLVTCVGVGVLLGLDAWYTWYGMEPGWFTVAVMLLYLSPPAIRAVKQYRQDSIDAIAHNANVQTLQTHLSRLPEAQLLTRLAAMASQRRITGVINAVESVIQADTRADTRGSP